LLFIVITIKYKHPFSIIQNDIQKRFAERKNTKKSNAVIGLDFMWYTV